MSSRSPLVIRAGSVATATLRERGFEPDLFSTLVGASGGPKWLVLSQLDRVLARRLVAGRSVSLDAIGSSIGSFRHACLAQRDPLAAIERFEAAYVEQAYEEQPSAGVVSRESRRILEVLLGGTGAEEIVAGKRVRCHVVTARLRDPARARHLRLLLGASALVNAASRRALRTFYERATFAPDSAQPIGFRDFTSHALPLRVDNVADAILAGGSIPLVMEPVRNIVGAPPGLYLDGGILDYHFDFRFDTRPGLTLFPHFFDRIVPGWFDKPLPWRRVRGDALERVVMIAPSDDFIANLPGGRVPDRADFQRMATAARQRCWREVLDRCRELGDALEDAIERGRIADELVPF